MVSIFFLDSVSSGIFASVTMAAIGPGNDLRPVKCQAFTLNICCCFVNMSIEPLGITFRTIYQFACLLEQTPGQFKSKHKVLNKMYYKKQNPVPTH